MPDESNPLLGLLLRTNAICSPLLRRQQVEQYTQPDKNILPEQTLRPTALSKFGNQPFKSQSSFLPPTVELPDTVAGKSLQDLQLPLKLDENKVYGRGPGDRAFRDWSLSDGTTGSLNSQMGLGHATNAIGVDKATGKPYLSQFDSWDFAEPSKFAYPFGQMLRAAGKPFNIYERIPIQLEKGKIPKYIGTRGEDITIPPLAKELLRRAK